MLLKASKVRQTIKQEQLYFEMCSEKDEDEEGGPFRSMSLEMFRRDLVNSLEESGNEESNDVVMEDDDANPSQSPLI